MTAADVQRFVSDVKGSGELQKGVLAVKQGGLGLTELVTRARAEGYDITTEEVKSYVLGQAATIATTSKLSQSSDGDIAVVTSTMDIQAVALIVPFVVAAGVGREPFEPIERSTPEELG